MNLSPVRQYHDLPGGLSVAGMGRHSRSGACGRGAVNLVFVAGFKYLQHRKGYWTSQSEPGSRVVSLAGSRPYPSHGYGVDLRCQARTRGESALGEG